MSTTYDNWECDPFPTYTAEDADQGQWRHNEHITRYEGGSIDYTILAGAGEGVYHDLTPKIISKQREEDYIALGLDKKYANEIAYSRIAREKEAIKNS